MRREGHRAPLRTFLVRALSFAAISALILNNAAYPVLASDYRAAPALAETSAAGQLNAKFLPLGIGKSVVVDLPRDVKDVLVADPKVANAVICSTRRAYIIGASVGQTNVFFFDHSGQQIIGLDIAVTRDLNGLRAAIRQALPDADIKVEGLGEGGIVLTGNVQSPLAAQTAFDIAARLVEDGRKVVNAITVHGRDQVMLKVTVAEMQRDVIKQLGIDLNGSIGSGTSVLTFNNTNPFPVYGSALVTGNAITSASLVLRKRWSGRTQEPNRMRAR